MFLLAISSTHALIDAWTPVGNRFSIVLGLESMWNYLASRIFPLAAGLAICGAIIQFAFNRPGYLALGRLRRRFPDGQRTVASDQQDDDVTEKNMLGPDPNSFMSLVMACIPTVVVAFATRDAWTWRRSR